MIEELAQAIADGMKYHVFMDGVLVQSFYFPGSVTPFIAGLRRKNPKARVQVKYLTNTLAEEKLA